MVPSVARLTTGSSCTSIGATVAATNPVTSADLAETWETSAEDACIIDFVSALAVVSLTVNAAPERSVSEPDNKDEFPWVS
ncbi:hypothetical protein SDC9_126500 [bioreactor metagenome]|uniref:Uncharacterized protein n=1 Tax=bioreactor metagenome TaxID=1076179 RepID=A0A645CQV9_9ZZZZ